VTRQAPRIAIDRIHVACGMLTPRPAPPPLITGDLGATRPGDRRIVIRSLHIDVEATLDAATARRLGNDVARELAARLPSLHHHDRRRRAANAIHVNTLRVHLWGEAASHPPIPEIAAALFHALEDQVDDAC
jgi:hypothetical protein